MATILHDQLTALFVALGEYIYRTVISTPVYFYHLFSDLFARASEHPLFWFISLFIFRYLRLVVHCISFWKYKPTPIPESPTITPQDCTVIIPTVDPSHFEFIECLQSCLLNRPKQIIIVTVGLNHYAYCKKLTQKYTNSCPDTEIDILISQKANKRRQVALAIPSIKTKIAVLLDDHVLWGRKFLTTALAPFEDRQIGAVGTNKCVRKEHRGFNILSFWNMLGALYLERHNFEIRATNAIDGGVFVISGRTSLHRSEILQDPAFLSGFTNERFFFGFFGPLNADDDNYITRFEVSRGWKIKIQYSDDACIETTLGAYPKFVQQCLRWVRTTWRSNSASLFTDRTVWRRQPWCVYAVYITSFFNFALFNDAGLAYLLWNSGYGTLGSLTVLGVWIFATKMVKLWPYFQRYPEDLRMLPGYFAFAYFHSLIKGYALLTFWNCHWGGRDLDAITRAASGGNAVVQGSPEVTNSVRAEGPVTIGPRNSKLATGSAAKSSGPLGAPISSAVAESRTSQEEETPGNNPSPSLDAPPPSQSKAKATGAPTSFAYDTSSLAPCQHCFESRCQTIMIILILLITCVVHYLIAKSSGLPVVPPETPRDWARGAPSVETFEFDKIWGWGWDWGKGV